MYSYVFFSKFIVIAFIFRSLVHFELILYMVCGRVSYLIWDSKFAEKTILFPLNCLGILVKTQQVINIRVYFWTLNSVALIYISFVRTVLHQFNYCSFIVSLELE